MVDSRCDPLLVFHELHSKQWSPYDSVLDVGLRIGVVPSLILGPIPVH